MALIEARRGDITGQEVDAIVNAANTALAGGGGVDGAIHRAAGPELAAECRSIPAGPHGRCPTGEAVVTGAGNLPCKKVIHTAGPVYGGTGEDARLLAACYRNSLLAAARHGLESVAFPNISTGVYGYPKAEAARIAVSAVRDTLPLTPAVKRVLFVCFDAENYRLYRDALGASAQHDGY